MTTPAWISSLSTGWMAVDMAAATSTGTTSYSGLLKLFQDLGSQVASSGSGLTSNEFSDLKTIVGNLNTGISTSGYLTSVTNAFVNGSSLNATWTGGAVTSTVLGNLSIGSTATQIGELVGKWFLGTDLPSDKVTISGQTNYITYNASSKALFGSNGPSMGDINQGQIGDCYLLSCLSEMAQQNPSLVRSMVTDNGNNTYGVRFYVSGQAQYVTVNNQLGSGPNFNLNTGSVLWASVVEKAYAEFVGSATTNGNSFTTIGNGGYSETALAHLTGTAVTDIFANGSSWYSNGQNLSNAQVASLISTRLARGDDVILGSYTDATDSSGRTTLVSDHAMSVYGYDSATGMLQIRNPWGSAWYQNWDTTFEISLSTLLAAGDVISIDSAGTTTPPSPTPTQVSAPVVTAQTANQVWRMGTSVNFTLASNTFTDPQGQQLSYTATLGNGGALPSWLSFNANTLTFTGTAPNYGASFSVKVTATDTSGASGSEYFNVATQAAAPYVAHQTNSLTTRIRKFFSFSLAPDTFVDPQGQAMTHSVWSSQGALPSWLACDTGSLSFWGNAPRRQSDVTIYVAATDTSGLSAVEAFNLSVRRGAAILSHAVAASAPTAALASAISQHQSGFSAVSLANPHA